MEIQKFAGRPDHDHVDMCVVCIMSHGYMDWWLLRMAESLRQSGFSGSSTTKDVRLLLANQSSSSSNPAEVMRQIMELYQKLVFLNPEVTQMPEQYLYLQDRKPQTLDTEASHGKI